MLQRMLLLAAGAAAFWGGDDDPLPGRNLAEVRTVAVSRPGLLTEGRPAVRAWVGEPQQLAAGSLNLQTVADPAKWQALADFARAWGVPVRERADGLCGSWEQIGPRCPTAIEQGKAVPLTEEARQAWQVQADELTRRGLEVLAVAEREEEGPVLLGLLGLFDPLRPDAEAEVAALRRAGIEVRVSRSERWPLAEQVGRSLGLTVGTEAASATDAAVLEADAPLGEVWGSLCQARRGADNWRRMQNYLLSAVSALGLALLGSALHGRLLTSPLGLVLLAVLGLLAPAAALALEPEAPGLMDGPYRGPGAVGAAWTALLQGLVSGGAALLAAGCAGDTPSAQALAFLSLQGALMMTAWCGRAGAVSLWDLPAANPALTAVICGSLLLALALTGCKLGAAIGGWGQLGSRHILSAALLTVGTLSAAQLMQGLNLPPRS